MNQEPSDPSEWKKSQLPQLSQLDSLQRCLICKDFLKAPVITSCNHTFCSHCIREHLMSTNQCPLCKTEQFESNLKRVILLEEIVLYWQTLRPSLLELLKKDENEKPASSPKTTSPAAEVIEISDDVEETGVKESSNDSNKPTVPSRTETVSCPICNQSMTAEFLQTSHLDDCLSGKRPKMPKPLAPKRKTEISSFFQPRKRQEVDPAEFYFLRPEKHHHEVKKLPKMDFPSLATAKLKSKLSSLKLSTSGTRNQLELRYNQYYLLHNSNLDSSHPVSDLVLRQRLMQWEKSHLAFSNSHGGSSIFGDALSHKSITDKDFPVGAWLEKYHEEFRDLIKKARASARAKKKQIQDAANSNEAKEETESREHNFPSQTEPSQGKEIEQNNSEPSKPDPTKLQCNEDDTFDFSNSTLYAPSQDTG